MIVCNRLKLHHLSHQHIKVRFHVLVHRCAAPLSSEFLVRNRFREPLGVELRRGNTSFDFWLEEVPFYNGVVIRTLKTAHLEYIGKLKLKKHVDACGSMRSGFLPFSSWTSKRRCRRLNSLSDGKLHTEKTAQVFMDSIWIDLADVLKGGIVHWFSWLDTFWLSPKNTEKHKRRVYRTAELSIECKVTPKFVLHHKC